MLANFFKITLDKKLMRVEWVNLANISKIGIMMPAKNKRAFEVYFTDGQSLSVTEPSEVRALAKLLDVTNELEPRSSED